MNFGDFKQSIDSLDQQSSLYQIDPNLFNHLYPMIEWVLFLSSFLWKNISKYASVGSSESPFPMNIPFPITEGFIYLFIFNFK
jgi:hypothetical protein